MELELSVLVERADRGGVSFDVPALAPRDPVSGHGPRFWTMLTFDRWLRQAGRPALSAPPAVELSA